MPPGPKSLFHTASSVIADCSAKIIIAVKITDFKRRYAEDYIDKKVDKQRLAIMIGLKNYFYFNNHITHYHYGRKREKPADPHVGTTDKRRKQSDAL